MRKAFRKLPEVHRWLLIALLEWTRGTVAGNLRNGLKRLGTSLSDPGLKEIIDDLGGTFLKLSAGTLTFVDWIHPSYRDLLIDELARDLTQQRRFLRRASPSGLKLAISEAGGQSGQRRFPLLTSAECWSDLQARATEILEEESPKAAGELIEAFVSAIADKPNGMLKLRLNDLLVELCHGVEEIWEESRHEIPVEALGSYVKACDAIGRKPHLPGFTRVWDIFSHDLKIILAEGFVSDPDFVERWYKVVKLAETRSDPTFEDPQWQRNYGEDLNLLAETIQEDLDGTIGGDPGAYAGEAYKLEDLARWLDELPPSRRISRQDLEHLASRCRVRAKHYASLRQEGAGTTTGSPSRGNEYPFDVEALFTDL